MIHSDNIFRAAIRHFNMALFLLSVLYGSMALAISLDEHPKLQAVADQLISGNYYTQSQLDAIFAQTNLQPMVLEAMQNPAEYKFNWGKYRKLFLREDRIQQGVEFWQQYASHLERAEQEYGVPASVIVAIIGVESKFGRVKGKYKVLDSLSTLVVGFERRSKFFATELKEFLILTKENKLPAADILGSYAGAVGFPQFISSSYRNYAVDFSGDGATDLINQPVDAIGSVANYFVRNGWQAGRPVTSPAHSFLPAELIELANRKRKVQYTAQALRDLGAPLSDDIDASEKLSVLMLDASEVVDTMADKKTYIVRAGDTTCEIAEQQGVSCSLLFKVNKLDKLGTIYRGQRLTIPGKNDVLQVSANANKRHLVRGGETACEIAEQYEVSCKALFKANNLNQNGDILRGQNLLIPTSIPSSNDQLLAATQSEPGEWKVNVSKANDNKENSPAITAPRSGPVSELRYFFTHENFYVITRYNQSVLYAMAVHELSKAIAAAKHRQASPAEARL